MRIEELIGSGMELEIDRVSLHNRIGSTGAIEQVTQAHLRIVPVYNQNFNEPIPYFELTFDISRHQIEDYLPGTQFHLSITPAK